MANIASIIHFGAIRVVHPGVVSHVCCHEVTEDCAIPRHSHDFFEIECGVSGDGVQTLNGNRETFGDNDFFMLRPEDVHDIRCGSGRRLVYYNIGFERERLEFIDRSYRLEVTSRWLKDPDWARRVRLSRRTMEQMRSFIRELFAYKQRTMVLDRFLLNMFFELEKECLSPFRNCPEWLQEAVYRLDSPARLRQGPRALAELSGYSLEYVGRTLKQCSGMTSGQVVNMIRMEHASAMLAIGTGDICAVAAECGFESMSRFFKLFKDAYGCTPRVYRLRHRLAGGGG